MTAKLLTQKELDAIQERVDKATDMVGALCQVRGTVGSRRWVMSIPAQPGYDPDLVIAAALKDIPALLELVKELKAERDECARVARGYQKLNREQWERAEKAAGALSRLNGEGE